MEEKCLKKIQVLQCDVKHFFVFLRHLHAMRISKVKTLVQKFCLTGSVLIKQSHEN